MTRAEAVWVLVTAAGNTLSNVAQAPFPDMPIYHPYAAAVAYAKAGGIIDGYDNGRFGPNDTLTRGQVAKMVILLKNLK